MQIEFYGLEKNEEEHCFNVSISENFISFTIDKKRTLIQDDYRTIIQNLKNYHDNSDQEIEYKERAFFKYFDTRNSKCIENMIRAFAVSSAYLNIDLPIYDEKDIISNLHKYFFNNLLIDWSDKLDFQPQMYFLQKEIIEKDKTSVDFLYKNRLLQKLSVKSFENILCYYVPFDFPKINNIKILNHYHVWNKILNGINKEVARLTQGNN